MKISNHVLGMHTSPLHRGFCHASGHCRVTDGKRFTARAQAPPLLACALGKSVDPAVNSILYTDWLF